MKAEHRHELKTNELAAWLAHFPQWLKENLRMIIYIAVVVVLVAGAYFWKHYQKNVVSKNEMLRFTALTVELARNKQQCIIGQEQGIDYSYTFIQTSNTLQEFANTAKNQNTAALALIKSAEALRIELHYHQGLMDQQYYSGQIEKAKNLYSQALDKAQDNSVKAQALLGQGLCEEELGNFENARQIYTKIKQDSSLEGTTAAAAAAQRLLVMDNYKEKVAFIPSPRSSALPINLESVLSNVESETIKALAPVISPNIPGSE